MKSFRGGAMQDLTGKLEKLGEVIFTVGEATIEAKGGQILVVPASVPHKYVRSGAGLARHIDIHTSRRMITERLEGISPLEVIGREVIPVVADL
jgi:hypothetical protein